MAISKVGDTFFRLNLPSVYQETYSYYEQLTFMASKIDEIIDSMNDFQKNYETYTDNKIAILKTNLEAQILNVYTYADSMKINLVNLIGASATQLTQAYTNLINLKVIDINTRIDYEVTALNNRIGFEILNIKNYVDNKLIDVMVLNGITGQVDTIQNTLNDIINLFRANALKASEYDALNLTATAYDNYLITAQQYDFDGKTLLI